MKLTIYDYKELNFVELNYTGSNETYIRCDKESKYIDSVVFNIFSRCFETANKLYEYYGPTKYNARRIIPLRNELLSHLNDLQAVTTLEAFEEIIGSHFLGQEFLEALKAGSASWSDQWKEVCEKLVVINRELVRLCEKCADEEKILWVIGY